MNDTPQAPVDPAAADQARELAQAIVTRNEAEANLTNAVATGDNKLIADRGRGYVTAAREVGKLSSIVAGGEVLVLPAAALTREEPAPSA